MATHLLSKGQVLIWDVTCSDTFAPPHGTLEAKDAGLIPTQAEEKKRSKYSKLLTRHHLVPIAIVTSRVFGPEADNFIKDLGHHAFNSMHSGEIASYSHILQNISVVIQRGKTTSILDSLPIGPNRIWKIPSMPILFIINYHNIAYLLLLSLIVMHYYINLIVYNSTV